MNPRSTGSRALPMLLAAGVLLPRSASALANYYAMSPDQESEINEALTPDEQARLAADLRSRDQLDATAWKAEIAAQAHEVVIDRLWDDLRRAKDPVSVARSFAVESVALPVSGPGLALKDGVVLARSAGSATSLAAAAWRARLAAWREAGWRLAQSEWHHDEFHPEGTPPWSFVKVVLQLVAPDGGRVEYRGRLRITWREPADGRGEPAVAAVDAGALERLSRDGPAPFRTVLDRTFTREPNRGSTMLLAWDLAGTGRSDLVLPGLNVRYRNLGQGAFKRERFLAHPVEPDTCGVFADVDGDGQVDYLCAAGTPQRLLLYRGAPGGRFPDPPVEATADDLDLKAGSVIGVGDFDGDGAPDIWVGQYRNPYLGGPFPTPYYDANDGYPAYLMRNDGKGRFTDVTEAAGVGAKRHRRNYGAVFLDLFGEGRLDLLTVNDFQGVDVWRNTGGGKFVEATPTAVDDPMNFGMGVAVDDFARDGHLGFYVAGMGSTTMRRLVRLGLERTDHPEVSLTRTRMGYGSRLYLWKSPGVYGEPAWNDQIARSGWSWGVVGFDPDLDGDRDLYVANGFISGQTAQEYCTRFWCHDVYTGREESPKVVRHLMAASTIDVNSGHLSWNGFEKKKLFVRQSASEFVECANELGLAFEADTRNLVADDIDGDGRPDLVMLYEARRDAGNPGTGSFGIRVVRNELATRHHWLGVRLKAVGKADPFGAVVTVRTASGPRVGVVLAGDSWRSQQAPVRLFGLGDDPQVESVEVRWPGGAVTTVPHPGSDRYLTVAPPG